MKHSLKSSLFLIALLLCTMIVAAEKNNATEVPVSAEVSSAVYSISLGSYKLKATMPNIDNFAGPLIAVGIVVLGLLIYLLGRKIF